MTTSEVAVRQTMPPAVWDSDAATLMVPTHISELPLWFHRDQTELDADQMVLLGPLGIGADWDPRQVAAFLMECNKRQLDPWGKEVYLMRYKDQFAPDGFRYVTHIGIDGYRTRAESTGQYEGQTEPLYCGPDGAWTEVWPRRDVPPFAAKVGILRAGFRQPVYGVAHFEEYAGYKDVWDGPRGQRQKIGRELAPSWKPAAQGGKACIMTAKVAEALGFRKAFPRNFHGLYLEEEFYHLRGGGSGVNGAAVADSEAAQRRQEAFAQAQQDHDGADTSPVEPAATVAAGQPADEQITRSRLLDELAEQAEILGHSADHLTRRWSERRGGAAFADAAVSEIAAHVHAIRPHVVQALRDANRDDEANTYERAPEIGTCAELFGRGPHIPDGGEGR